MVIQVPRTALFWFTLALVLNGCTFEPPVASFLTIEGSWMWQESCGGIAFRCVTPDSVGYGRVISFDSRGIYREYRTDSTGTYFSSPYHIVRKQLPWSPEVGNVLIVDSLPAEMVIRLQRGGELVLEELCLDCYVHWYVRMHPI